MAGSSVYVLNIYNMAEWYSIFINNLKIEKSYSVPYSCTQYEVLSNDKTEMHHKFISPGYIICSLNL